MDDDQKEWRSLLPRSAADGCRRVCRAATVVRQRPPAVTCQYRHCIGGGFNPYHHYRRCDFAEQTDADQRGGKRGTPLVGEYQPQSRGPIDDHWLGIRVHDRRCQRLRHAGGYRGPDSGGVGL
ncbi:hypothetical protein D3C72_1861480 [compost metagenome]